jgi:hypothetical protein
MYYVYREIYNVGLITSWAERLVMRSEICVFVYIGSIVLYNIDNNYRMKFLLTKV